MNYDEKMYISKGENNDEYLNISLNLATEISTLKQIKALMNAHKVLNFIIKDENIKGIFERVKRLEHYLKERIREVYLKNLNLNTYESPYNYVSMNDIFNSRTILLIKKEVKK